MQIRIGVLIVMCLLMAGCGEENIIEELAILQSVSFDVSENEQYPIKTTVLFPTVSKEGMFDTKTLTVNGKSTKDSFFKLQNLTNLKLVGGQGTILFGEELAKKGLIHFVDNFTRDPEVGTRSKFVLVQGKGDKLLTTQMPDVPDNAEYLYTFLEKVGSENKILNTSKFRFFRDYYDDGIDPVLPVFSYDDRIIQLRGAGIFKDDQYVKCLSLRETQILNYLSGDIKNGGLILSIKDRESGENSQLMLSGINSNNDVKVNIKNSQDMRVELSLDLKGSVLEYTGTMDLSDTKNQKRLEKQVGNYLNDHSKKLFHKLQVHQADPIGIGRIIRNRLSYDKWKEMKWREVYPDLNINVEAKVDLVVIGKSK
jgi:spore germination protein